MSFSFWSRVHGNRTDGRRMMCACVLPFRIVERRGGSEKDGTFLMGEVGEVRQHVWLGFLVHVCKVDKWNVKLDVCLSLLYT